MRNAREEEILGETEVNKNSDINCYSANLQHLHTRLRRIASASRKLFALRASAKRILRLPEHLTKLCYDEDRSVRPFITGKITLKFLDLVEQGISSYSDILD